MFLKLNNFWEIKFLKTDLLNKTTDVIKPTKIKTSPKIQKLVWEALDAIDFPGRAYEPRWALIRTCLPREASSTLSKVARSKTRR